MEADRVKTIFLIGFMASGKSTVGRLLSKRLGFSFIDTDKLIEQEEGIGIPEIFKLKGEDYFRELESRILKGIVNSGKIRNSVVATGGGLPCFGDNLKIIKDNGVVIYLKVDVEDIINRIDNADKRPVFKELLDGKELKERIRSLLDYREYYYNQADIVIYNDSSKTPFVVVEEILKDLNKR